MLEELEVLRIVVSLGEDDVRGIVAALSTDFYVDADSVRSAVISQRSFNLMHFATSTWIVSREDLILSKLVWARDAGSELQLRDVKTLVDESMDRI